MEQTPLKAKELLKNVAKAFDLNLDYAGGFKYLVLTKREIIIRNFLSDCPDPVYVRYGNRDKQNIGLNVEKYLDSEDYEKEFQIPQGCVISERELEKELTFVPNIPFQNLKKEVETSYSKIKEHMGISKRLTLIWNPSEEESESEIPKEILLHEFVHELLESNGILPRSWKWNEGLVTYITNYVLGFLHRYKEEPKRVQQEMWYTYQEYTRKWINLLEKESNPKKRKEIILDKIKDVNKIESEDNILER